MLTPISKHNTAIVDASDESTLVGKQLEFFLQHGELMRFPLRIEVIPDWEVFLHDLALIRKLLNSALVIEADQVVHGESRCQLELLDDTTFLCHDLLEAWDCQHELDRVVSVEFLDVVDLILLCEIFKEVFVLSRPCFDWEL